MASNSAVSGFCLDAAIWGQQHASHQAKGSEALRQSVRLHVSVIILASPYEASLAKHIHSFYLLIM